MLVAQLAITIYLQKFAVGPTSGQINLSFLVSFLLLAFYYRGVGLSSLRLALFLLLVGAACLSQLAAPGDLSTLSLVYLASTYLLFCIKVTLTRDEYGQLFGSLSKLMVLPAIMVFVQFVYQKLYGVGSNLLPEQFLPSWVFQTGYIAQSSIDGWLVWNRPNGFFFLETSFCSVFLAVTVLGELQRTKRRWRWIALFGAALVLTNGASGLTLLALGLAWMARRRPEAIFLFALGIVGLAILFSGAINLAAIPRLSELANPDSSGYMRLIAPFVALADLLSDPSAWLWGHGAGQISTDAGSAWPVSKLAYEYGLVTTIIWVALTTMAMWSRANPALAFALFMVFQFTGGYLLSPIMVLLIYLVCSAPQVRPDLALPKQRADEV